MVPSRKKAPLLSGGFVRPLLAISYCFQALSDFLLQAAVGRLVESGTCKRFRQALHLRKSMLEVMGMLVPGAIAPLLHRLGRSVSQMERHRLIAMALNGFNHRVQRPEGCMGLESPRQGDRSLRKREPASGNPQEVYRLHGCHALLECARTSHANIFDGHPHALAQCMASMQAVHFL